MSLYAIVKDAEGHARIYAGYLIPSRAEAERILSAVQDDFPAQDYRVMELREVEK